MQQWRRVSWAVLVAAMFGGAAVGRVNALDGAEPQRSARQLLAASRVLFVENQGQFTSDVAFRTVLPRQVATVVDGGLVLTQLRTDADGLVEGHNVVLRFVFDGETHAESAGRDLAITRTNYLLGNDRDGWITEVPSWDSVTLHGTRAGSQVEVHGRRGYLEYDVHLDAGVPASSMEVLVEGAQDLRLRDDGGLEIRTPLGVIQQLPPRTWEEEVHATRHDLGSRVELLGSNRFRFVVEGRTPSRSLVIDPGLIYGTFLDTSGPDIATAIAADADGSAYVVGDVFTNDFPVTPGAFQPEKSERGTWQDLIVAKLTPDGSALEYATYLGGTGTEHARFASVNDMEEVLISGSSSGGSDFPTTPGAYMTENSPEGPSGFVTQLNSTGTNLVVSTFFGGSDGTSLSVLCAAIDSAGRLVIGGATDYLDLPVTANAVHQSPPSPGASAFLARLSSNTGALDYCTFLGATTVRDISVDASSAIYATGYGHASDGLLTTPGVFQPTSAGSNDGFILKLDEAGTLEWCTYLGGAGDDRFYGIELDPSGQPMVSGQAKSFNFPVTPDALIPFFSGGPDIFVSKLSSDGTSLVWSTRVSGSDSDGFGGFEVDASGVSTLFIGTSSQNMPVTPNAFATELNEPHWADGYVSKLSADGSELLYGSYIGSTGTDVDVANALATDPQGNAYITGYTSGADFPVTPGAFDTELDRFSAMYVVKFDLSTWQHLGNALPDVHGVSPRLTAVGSLQPLSPGSVHVDQARSNTMCTIVLGLSPIYHPFKFGVMVPAPDKLLNFFTDGSGTVDVGWPAWPPGIPSGIEVFMQAWIQDVSSPSGFTASNGITATTPASP